MTVPLEIAFFNSAFVRSPADPVACIDVARAFYAERGRPFTVRFREQDHAAVEGAGLAFDTVNPLMVVNPADIASPEGVEVRQVDLTTWDEYTATMAEGFGMPLELLRSFFGTSLVGVDEFVGFNAFVDGRVASTSALMITDEVAGIYNVATPEAFRRRGLGEATTRAAVVEGARRGCTIATLQSSAMGYPIYERMGFRTVTSWLSFTGGAT